MTGKMLLASVQKKEKGQVWQVYVVFWKLFAIIVEVFASVLMFQINSDCCWDEMLSMAFVLDSPLHFHFERAFLADG